VQSREAKKFLGKSVRDSYGRYIGTMVGFCVEPTGVVTTIGLDQGREGLVEFPGDRLRLEKDSIVLSPEWEAGAAGMSRNMTSAQAHLVALKELAKEMGISESMVDLMVKNNHDDGRSFVESYETLAEGMAARGAEIEKQTNALDDFLDNLTAQYKAGDLEEYVYELSRQYCKVMRVRNLREAEELSKTLKAMVEPRKATVEREEAPASVEETKKQTPVFLARAKLKNIEIVEYGPRRSSARERMISELP
jgi:hypothetical protein